MRGWKVLSAAGAKHSFVRQLENPRCTPAGFLARLTTCSSLKLGNGHLKSTSRFSTSANVLKERRSSPAEEDNLPGDKSAENEAPEDEVFVARGRGAPKPLQESKDEETGERKVKLPPLSDQQRQARDILKGGKQNIVINACAGSGKTTTLLQMAANIKKPFLALLYNRVLRAETIARAKALGLGNLTIDNYHGLAYRYYTTEADTDQGLKRIVEDDMQPIMPLPDFDYLILDEQQDMNPIIYNFVQKLLRDAAKIGVNSPQLLLLGDPRQEIYQFNNADKRFLTHCRELFPGQYQDSDSGKIENRTWVEINQMVSFRMTSQIARFINQQLLRGTPPPKIGTIKDSPKDPRPRYVVCDAYSDEPLDELKRLLSLGLQPSDILIMAPSLRAGKNPIRHLANQITLQLPHLRLHIPSDDVDRVSERVSKGKILFASYHQAKGIEREATILFNFSSSYYDYYDRHPLQVDNVSNVQYVAVTRAKKHLILIHHYLDDYLPFINQKRLYLHCERIARRRVKPTRTEKELEMIESPKHRWKVTDLTRNIPETVISSCFEELDLELARKPNKYRIWPETEVKIGKDDYEAVADITGAAVVALFEYEHQGKCTLVSDVIKAVEKGCHNEPLSLIDDKYIDHIYEIKQRLDEEKLKIADVLFMANISNMLQSGYIYKVHQIPLDRYDWFTLDHSDAVYNILDNQISEKAWYEVFVGHKFTDVFAGKKNILGVGRVDVFDYGKLWELKWTGSLRPEHVLQVALYGAISRRMKIKKAAEREFEDSLPPELRSKKRSKKKPVLDIDYDNITDPELLNRLSRMSNQLLHIPTGQRVMVKAKIDGKMNGYIEVLRKLVKAKNDPPPLAISDKKFLAEAKKGFPSIVGRCTVPVWLSMGGALALPPDTETNPKDVYSAPSEAT